MSRFRRGYSPNPQTDADRALAAKLGRILKASPDLYALAVKAVAVGEAMTPVPTWAVQGRALLNTLG